MEAFKLFPVNLLLPIVMLNDKSWFIWIKWLYSIAVRSICVPALTSDLLVGAAEQTKKCLFCFFLIVRVLVFLFFIDRYSSVYHLPMINLTKLTVTRRRVYPKMTTFKNARNCFTGALLVGSAEQTQHCVCSAEPTSKAPVKQFRAFLKSSDICNDVASCSR